MVLDFNEINDINHNEMLLLPLQIEVCLVIVFTWLLFIGLYLHVDLYGCL